MLRNPNRWQGGTPLSLLLWPVIGCLLAASLTACGPPRLPSLPPGMSLSFGGHEAPMHRGNVSWVRPGSSQPLQWPPLLPKYPLCVQPGVEVGFTALGVTAKPASLKLELWNQKQLWEAGEQPEPLHSTLIDKSSQDGDRVSFSWTLPELADSEASTTRFGIRVTAVWEAGGEQAEARYYGVLDFASPQAVKDAHDIPLRFLKATWSGAVDDVKALVVPEFRWHDGRADTALNPFYMALEGPQDYLTRKFDG